jgi:hypothetical protein
MVINPYAYSAAGFSTEAQDYFDRLDTASDTTYTPYKQPLANYIDGLVALGGAYWTTMETAASFVGVGLEGCLVPLKSGMPTLTNNGFVIGDLNVLTGLLGDTSSTLNTNWSPSSNASDDLSFSVYCTGTPNTGYVIGAADFTAASNIQHDGLPRNNCQGFAGTRTAVSTGNLSGTTRSLSTAYDHRSGGVSDTETQTAVTPTVSNFSIFSRTENALDTVKDPTNARIATYHAGAALNLVTLESLQATLISEIAAI